MSEIEERVLACFRAVFPDLNDDELRVLSQPERPEWDSLASLSLITVIEEEFDLALSDDEVAEMDSFTSVCARLGERAGSDPGTPSSIPLDIEQPE